MTRPRRRVTQKDIARTTGVSQAVVSLVLNNRTDTGVRIAPETRERVLRAIRETGYVADPAARSLVARRNRILGVFTSEPVFPSADYYRPLLAGVEDGAERLGSDLLLLSSAPFSGGRRRIFQGDERFRLADGLLLLGREVDRDGLARLVAQDHPFVSVGRRDDAGGPVPCVGADYPAAVAALVRRAARLGHTRFAYIGTDQGPEPFADRLRGFRDATGAQGVHGSLVGAAAPSAVLDALAADESTVAFVDEPADVGAVAALAEQRGIGVPGDLSLVAPGIPTAYSQAVGARGFSGFRVPREEMGRAAVELLTRLLEDEDTPTRLLLDCEPVEGGTLASPRHAR